MITFVLTMNQVKPLPIANKLNFFFSKDNSHKPINITVKENILLQLKAMSIDKTNKKNLFSKTAKRANKIAGINITSGWKSNKLILKTNG